MQQSASETSHTTLNVISLAWRTSHIYVLYGRRALFALRHYIKLETHCTRRVWPTRRYSDALRVQRSYKRPSLETVCVQEEVAASPACGAESLPVLQVDLQESTIAAEKAMDVLFPHLIAQLADVYTRHVEFRRNMNEFRSVRATKKEENA